MTPDQLSLHRVQALHIYPPPESEKSLSDELGVAWCYTCNRELRRCVCEAREVADAHDERTEDVEAGKPHTSGADFYTSEEE